ncbi:MAG: exodeoxyribonuclease III [Armatimonadota bacterium]
MSSSFKVATFNVNSVRSRLPILLQWLTENNCDVLCLQETKVTNDMFPETSFNEIGYNCVFHGQKSYNGVAIITKNNITNISKFVGDIDEFNSEARFIKAEIKNITFINTYIPQGTDITSPKFIYKLNWIKNLKAYFMDNFNPEDNIIWLGDFNIAPESYDVYDHERLWGTVCHHPDERDALYEIKDWGFIDILRKHHPNTSDIYTFWDYRVPNALKRRIGWRIDHIWATRPIADKSVNCWVDIKPRQMEKPSDHTVLMAEFNL